MPEVVSGREGGRGQTRSFSSGTNDVDGAFEGGVGLGGGSALNAQKNKSSCEKMTVRDG